MSKKLKYLSAIPLYGTCILLIYLFVSSLKDKISTKKLYKTFFICVGVSAICWYMVVMIMYIISKQFIYYDFNILGIIITMIVGGYLMNAFTFTYIDKKWDHLYNNEKKEEKSFLELNQKKIMLIGLVLAMVVIALATVTIIAFDLV